MLGTASGLFCIILVHLSSWIVMQISSGLLFGRVSDRSSVSLMSTSPNPIGSVLGIKYLVGKCVLDLRNLLI